MTDVFVSYARDDQAKAQAIAKALEARGFDVWWDPQLLPGESYASKIQGVLESAKAVLVLWSTHSVESPWVLDEAGMGRSRAALVPVLIDAVEPPIGFRQLQAENLIQWPALEAQANFERVVKALEQLRGRAADPPRKGTRQGGDALSSPGTRPLTRPSGVLISCYLGIALGLVWGSVDFESAKPSTNSVPEALAMGAFLGIMFIAPILMLSRWLAALGARRWGRVPQRFFSPTFSMLLGLSALAGFGLTLFADKADGVGPTLTFLVGALLTLPVFSFGYFLISQFSKKPAAARITNLPWTPFEKFGGIGVGLVLFAAFVVAGITSNEEKKEGTVPDAIADISEPYGLTAKEVAVLPLNDLINTALQRTSLEAIERGASNGDGLGQALLCAAYDQGVGVEASAETARRWCESGSKTGSHLAGYALSTIVRAGTSTFAADETQADALLLAAADGGDARAQYEIGWRNVTPEGADAAQIETGLRYTRFAAEQGFQSAQFNLAWLYENGKGVPQDYATAMLWYQKLADEDSPVGLRGLGWMKMQGWGGPQDFTGARELLTKASEKGDGNASALLASLHEEGKGGDANLDEAVRLYRLAIQQGFSDAQANLTRLGFAPSEPPPQ